MDRPPVLVVDASVGVAALTPERHSAWARAVLGDSRVSGVRLVVPSLFWLELIHALSRGGRTGEELIAALRELDEFGIQTRDLDRADLLLSIDLMERHRLSAYDAVYLSLAETMNGRLATADGQLIVAAQQRAIAPGASLHRGAIQEPEGGYAADPTWARWPGTSAYLAKLRAQAEEAARSARS